MASPVIETQEKDLTAKTAKRSLDTKDTKDTKEVQGKCEPPSAPRAKNNKNNNKFKNKTSRPRRNCAKGGVQAASLERLLVVVATRSDSQCPQPIADIREALNKNPAEAGCV